MLWLQKVFKINGIKLLFMPYVCALFFFLMSVVPSVARDNVDVQMQLRSEGEKPEFCFVFHRAVHDVSRQLYLKHLTLYEEGKKKRLKAEDLSLTPKHVCVQNLTYNKSYQIALRRMKVRAVPALSYRFKVPNRKQKLRFLPPFDRSQIPLHGEVKGHALKAVNVPRVHLMLYRLSSKNVEYDAWQNFKTSYLVPSESLLFARAKGEVVFETDLVFDDTPNKTQNLMAPLPSQENLLPGLYYLAAAPKNEKEAPPSLMAGKWFLVSDLSLEALQDSEGLYIKSQPLNKGKVKISLWDAQGKKLEEKTGKGEVFFKKKIKEVALITAQSKDNVAFLSSMRIKKKAGELKKVLFSDQFSYRPGDQVYLKIDPSEKKEGMVQLFSPDGTLYAQREAKDTVRFVLPYIQQAGFWSVKWIEGEKVRAHLQIEVSLDQNIRKTKIEYKENHLVIYLYDKQGKPFPFQKGSVKERCTRPVHAGWPSYQFGVVPKEACQKRSVKPFLTDVRGVAKIAIEPEAQWQKEYEVSFDGVTQKTFYTLPASFEEQQIGIYGRAKNNRFAENSDATFDIVALGQAVPKILYYTFFEEGQRFEWYSQEDYWSYRKLPKNNRIGGGSFSVKPNRKQTISWPITTGSYFIEIANAKGNVLARLPFEAGKVGAPILKKRSVPQKSVQQEVEKKKTRINRVNYMAPRERYIWSQKKIKVEDGGKEAIEGLALFSLVSSHCSIDRLVSFIQTTPITTQELSDWLYLVYLWKPSLQAMALLPEEGFRSLIRWRLKQMAQYQRFDGGFVSRAQGESSLSATIAALRVLYLYQDEAFADVQKHAEKWLKDYLKKVWFDESERKYRALAFALLAQYGKIDASLLYYFAQVNEGQKLSIVTLAALISGFEALEEKVVAQKWFNKMPKDWASSSHALALLAPYKDLSSFDLEDGYFGLVTAALLARKAGTWRIEVNGQKKKMYGFSPITGDFTNKAKRPLYGMHLYKQARRKVQRFNIKKSFYHDDGTPLQKEEVLVSGQNYLMKLTGHTQKVQKVIVPISNAFTFKSFRGLGHSLLHNVFPWVDQNVASPLAFDQTEDGVQLLAPADVPWQSYFLLTTRVSGAVVLPEFYVLDKGQRINVKQEELKFKVF